MSLSRLYSFFRDTSHEVLDVFLVHGQLAYLRVISNQYGILFLIRVQEFQILWEDPEENKHIRVYTLEEGGVETTTSREKYDLLSADVFSKHVPKNCEWVLFFENVLMESKDVVYNIRPLSSLYGMTILTDLEWFYENHKNVVLEIRNGYDKIEQQLCEMYKGVQSQVSQWCKNSDRIQLRLHHVWKHFMGMHQEVQEYRKLYYRVCTMDKSSAMDLRSLCYDIEYIAETFNETVQRNYKKRHLEMVRQKIHNFKYKIQRELHERIEREKNLMVRFALHMNKIVHILLELESCFTELHHLRPAILPLPLTEK